MSAQGPDRATTPEKTSLVWETPPDFYAWRDGIWGFDVDAAANAENALRPLWFGPGGVREDAFDLNPVWRDYGDRFWCNPPYGDLLNWCSLFYMQGKHVFIEALLPANTGSRWFKFCAETAAEIELLTGRLQFLVDGKPGKNSNTTDSMLVRWRPGVSGGATIRLTDWRKEMK